jgi:hypothetical protein
MNIDIIRVLIAAGVATVAWLVIGMFLYENPIVKPAYKAHEKKGILKKWENMPKFLTVLVGVLIIQTLPWAVVYAFIKPVLPGMFFANALVFALILVVIKNIPKFVDMALMTTYPGKLLWIELINGSISSLLIALVYAWLI